MSVIETLTEATVLVTLGLCFIVAGVLVWVGNKLDPVRSR